MHDQAAMTIPPEPPPLRLAGSDADAARLRRGQHSELNRLLSRATRCLEDMDLSGANEALKRANEAASGISRSRKQEVEM